MSMASSLNESLCHAHSSSSEGGDPANEDGIVYKGGHSHDDDSGRWWESINVCPRMRERNSMDQRLFLLGLEKYGKGDQRIIFRKFVISRTPTQVASHAHKCFIRLNSINKDRRRTSIHDITTVTNGDTSPVKLMPLLKLQGSLQKFFSIICRPLIPAVGTPVNLPVPAASPMVYPLQTPFSGAIVSAPL